LGIGTTSLSIVNLYVQKNITGGTIAYGIAQGGTVLSGVTSQAYGFDNSLVTQAASFTLANYYHFSAGQGAIGSSSSVTTQTGYNVFNNLTGATNNYGFRGQIPSGTNRWNIYMDGTAANYMAGALTLNGAYSTSSDVALIINASIPAINLRTSAGVGRLTIASNYANGNTTSILVGTATNNPSTQAFLIDHSNGAIIFGSAASVNASAKVQIDSTTSGFLPPRMTAAQRTAIATPATGLIVYQTDSVEGLYVYSGASWKSLTMV
jgi:hypothetical protein